MKLINRSVRNHLIMPIILGFIGVAMILLETCKTGIRLSVLSIMYLEVAKNISSGKGFIMGQQILYMSQPPLYPLVLSFFNFIGLGAVEGARFMNAMIFGSIIFISSKWLFERMKNVFIAILGSIIVLFSVKLAEIYTMLWTESFFIFFAMLAMLWIEKYLGTKKKIDFYLAAFFAMLTCLTRHMGITMIFSFIVIILLIRSFSLRYKIKNILLFSLISCSLLALWFIRNHVLGSELINGGFHMPVDTFLDNIYYYIESIALWFIPYAVFRPASLVFVLLGLLLLTAFINNYKAKPEILVFGCFLAIYSVYLIILASSFRFDRISDRLLLPIYIPLIFIIFSLLDAIIEKYSHHPSSRIMKKAALSLLVLWALFSFIRTTYKAYGYLLDQIGSSCITQWDNSETLDYLQKAPFEGNIYSNQPYVITSFIGRAAKDAPRKYVIGIHRTKIPTRDILDLKKYLEVNRRAYLVLFDRDDLVYAYKTYYTMQELKALFKIELLVKRSDGMIYSVSYK